jgi:hypothetical protein
VLLAIAVVWGVAVLVLNSGGPSFEAVGGYLFGGMAFFVVAVILGVVCIVSAVRRRARLAQVFPLPYVLLIVFLAVVFVGVSYNGALWLRLQTSRGALESVAAKVQAGETPKTPLRVGTFRVREIDTAGDSVRFIVGESLLDDFGVVYSPSGEPPVVGEDAYVHFSGAWWLWERSW